MFFRIDLLLILFLVKQRQCILLVRPKTVEKTIGSSHIQLPRSPFVMPEQHTSDPRHETKQGTIYAATAA